MLICTVAFLMIMNIYSTGGLVGTDPFYQIQFTSDYLTIMNATSCTQILPIVNRMGIDSKYRNWLSRNEGELRKLYDQNAMKSKINSMKCIDTDGAEIEIGDLRSPNPRHASWE